MRYLGSKIILIVAITFCTYAHAEDFFIVKVMGAIHVNSVPLKAGDKISTGDKISFLDPLAKAIVISPKRGQLILQKDEVAANSELELKLAALVEPKSNYLATRGLVTNENELIHYFDAPHVIVDSLKLKLLGNQFKMDEEEFYFIRFKYKNEFISKKLPSINKEGLSLFFSKKDLLQVDGVAVDISEISEMQFVHFNASTKSLRILHENISFIFVSEEELKKDLAIILPHIAEKDQIMEVKTFIDIVYGAIEQEQVEALLLRLK